MESLVWGRTLWREVGASFGDSLNAAVYVLENTGHNQYKRVV